MKIQTKSKKFIKFWLFPLVWIGLIFTFSALPTVKAANVYWQEFVIKKSAHIIEYAVLAFALYRAVRQEMIDKKAAYLVLCFCIAYAISDEFHQSFTPGREPTVRDVIFDTIGAVSALVISWKFLPIAPVRLKTLAKRLQLI